MRVTRTKYGARLTERGSFLSKVLRRPGPTHDLFDVLAAAVACFASGPRVAVLGFGGGGMIAPLRALGWHHEIRGVDRSPVGAQAFRALCAAWAGPVRVATDDAVRWLGRQRPGFDALVEDLSVPGPSGATKPAVSMERVAPVAAAKLGRRGVLIVNGLPVERRSWRDLVACWSLPGRAVLEVRLDRHENRVVLCGARLPPARDASRQLRAALDRLGSRMAGQTTVRSVT
jgi:hypothetical protein